MSKTRSLLEQMSRSQSRSSSHNSPSRRQYRSAIRPKSLKIQTQRQHAEIRYKNLTNLTKSQQAETVRESMKKRAVKNPQWKYDPYRINNTFSVYDKYRGVEEFPHNNKKYNTQFLKKTLEGGALNFTVRDAGFFPKPKDQLYSDHYKPIVTGKRSYNQDYELRASLFGKIWVDHKRDRIMDKYQIQANPFSTQRSNQLISTMRPARKHRFS